MLIVQTFGLIIWCCFLLIMLSFAADNENADVIKHCMNSTNSTSCSLTYEHVYKSLTKNENSFNISRALYPEGGKPSFLVRVNVYGPNKTHNSTPAQFIWSIHCLFSNVPASLLEMLSLGSIIVTSRTQELDVQIPAFCCNLSENIEKRKGMIQGFLTRALFEVSVDFVFISKGRLVLRKFFNRYHYSFKIFLRFWLPKSTRIIHHNQLLLTKFGRILRLINRWRQKCRTVTD